MRFYFFYFLFSAVLYSQTGLIEGKVINKVTGELLPYSVITVIQTDKSIPADASGEFLLRLPYGNYTIGVRCVGYESVLIRAQVSAQEPRLNLTASLSPKTVVQQEIEITGKRIDFVPNVQVLEKKDLVKIPNFNSDAMRSIKILPGVTSNNELASDYNVRGGSFDENLIYLNGYEIQRPFFLKQGIEENQSLLNVDLIDRMKFYSGAFPVNFGDKMSSALEVNYLNKPDSGKYTVRLGLLNSGVALMGRNKNFTWAHGLRYAYPTLFTGISQTSGKYRPVFYDVQSLMTFSITKSTDLELFLIKANNQFDLTPADWKGNFQTSYMDIKEVAILYKGNKAYRYDNLLGGFKVRHIFDKGILLTSHIMVARNREEENSDLKGDIYFSDNGYSPEDSRIYLASDLEDIDNDITTLITESNTSVIVPDIPGPFGSVNVITAGFIARNTSFNLNINETKRVTGTTAQVTDPKVFTSEQTLDLLSYSGYIQGLMQFGEELSANIGVRLTNNVKADELLFSPRAVFIYTPDKKHSFSLRWGYYYQPAFYHELKRETDFSPANLKSQRSVHYVGGWEYFFRNKMKFEAEVFYKKLSDIRRFYVDQIRLEYLGRERGDGYAYGFDLQFQGEIVNTMKTWIGYSYLNSREKFLSAGGSYNRRMLDQTHTLRIFLQDRMPRFPSMQAHVVFLFGSGYLFYPYVTRTQTAGSSTKTYIDMVTNSRQTFPFYFRSDLGLSYAKELKSKATITASIELLNVFNKYNVASYTWFNLNPVYNPPIRVQNVYSERFINLGIEYKFGS
ncbi:MAG: carboxypeptidase-like regulatory domain-containing protein [Ignavibacteriaceae bacterium]|nr:carboxypeptidase-like regulatory domain-containing protein [Ignavibacteriaceae bacterium]